MSRRDVKSAALELIDKLGEEVNVVNRDDSDATDNRGYPEERTITERNVMAVSDLTGPKGGDTMFGVEGSKQEYDIEFLMDDNFSGVDNFQGAGGDDPASLIVRESGKTYNVRVFDDAGEGILIAGCQFQQGSPPDGVSLPSGV
jgi:hypothetical protein